MFLGPLTNAHDSALAQGYAAATAYIARDRDSQRFPDLDVDRPDADVFPSAPLERSTVADILYHVRAANLLSLIHI